MTIQAGWSESVPSVVSRVLGAVLALLVLAACSSGDGQTDPGPAPPPGTTGEPTVGMNQLEPAPAGEPRQFGDVPVSATVLGTEPVQIDAQGVGEIAGPGTAVTVEIRNESGDTIDLAAFAVNAFQGDDVPAPASSSAPAAELSGALDPGAAATGVYVFRPAQTDAGPLVVEINYNASANVVLIDTAA